MTDTFKGQGLPIDAATFGSVTGSLGIDAATLWTVMAVETKGVGFLPDRRPDILFERHIFSRETNGAYDQAYPAISNPQPGGYGAAGANQYDRLAQAIALDRTAALRSASWGIGQIMGFNFAAAGYASVDDMVAAMVASENAQLTAMAAFLQSNKLAAFLQQKDWAGYAKHYNGPNYAINKYDQNLAAAYQKYSTSALPDIDARAAQLYLIYLGYNPGPVDGMPGSKTLSALAGFLTKQGLPASNVVTPDILASLQQAAGAI
ncbi:MAG TPA: N-acetylmuramidase domain-containing protein [Gallionella sp.]|nr:N-acetylmuramidase domain-containing protein [Gallionella sp.]